MTGGKKRCKTWSGLSMILPNILFVCHMAQGFAWAQFGSAQILSFLGIFCHVNFWNIHFRNGAGSGLNRPLTARSNLIFHWLYNVYTIDRTLLSAVQSTVSVFTLLLFMHLPFHLFKPAQPFTYRLITLPRHS